MSENMNLLDRALYVFDNYESTDKACENDLILIGCCIAYLQVEELEKKYDILRLGGDDVPTEEAIKDLEPRFRRAYRAGKSLPKSWQANWRERLPKLLIDVETYMACIE